MGRSEFDPIATDRRAWNAGRKVGANIASRNTRLSISEWPHHFTAGNVCFPVAANIVDLEICADVVSSQLPESAID
jgi:hypothetical protein